MDDYFPAKGYLPPPLVYDQERGTYVSKPGSTPARDPVIAPPAPSPSRFEKRGPYMICKTCNMAVQFCKGHAAAPVEGAPPISDVLGRANECKGK